MREAKKFPDKKDFGYWILFLVIFNVFVITFRLGDNTSVVDYIGFAGTIMSLILAVIAIIYSFYQNSTYVNSTQKLESSADKIEEITKELAKAKELQKVLFDFKGEVTNINESIAGLREVVSTIQHGVNNTLQSVEETRIELFGVINSSFSIEKEEYNYDSDYFRKVVDNSSLLSIFTLGLVYKSARFGFEFDISEWSRFYLDKFAERPDIEAENINMFENLLVGMLIIYEQIGFIEVANSNRFFQVEYINPKLADAIELKINGFQEEKYDHLYQAFIRMEEIIKSR
jgi:hypothetical protein